jgi:hypothetical protein
MTVLLNTEKKHPRIKSIDSNKFLHSKRNLKNLNLIHIFGQDFERNNQK